MSTTKFNQWRTNLSHVHKLLRDGSDLLLDFGSVIDVWKERVVYLQLDLSNVQFFFQIRQELDSCLMTATRRNWMRLRVGDCESQVLQA